MRAIMLMFDGLNRQFLPTWNEADQGLPIFRRRQKRGHIREVALPQSPSSHGRM